jgi:aspartate/methionine/tyrosine aminotransferase
VKPSKRADVAPFYVMEVAKAAAARQASHGDVIGLFVGQPATPAPRVVRERAVRAVADDVLGYTVTNGIPALREAIAADYQRRYRIAVDPTQVVVTTGSSAGFVLAALAAVDAGDQVAMASPGYPAYRNTLRALGVEVVTVETDRRTRFQPAVELLEQLAQPPKAVVIASPSNPTGTIIAPEELSRISAWCGRVGARLISDEIYHGISFGASCATAWQFGRNHLVVGSVSKYHSMTGWRLGWLLVPDDLSEAVERLQANLAICAPAVSQVAAVAAFTDEARSELDGHVARYARNREVLLRRLPELGITSFAPPDGAFYAYCDIGHLTDDSLQWCEDVLAATGVALAPGIDFDEAAGRRMMRLSFCGQTDELNQGLDRLAAYLGR